MSGNVRPAILLYCAVRGLLDDSSVNVRLLLNTIMWPSTPQLHSLATFS